MPRQPKKTDNRTPGETVPKQYRLRAETIADLKAIAEHLTEMTGIKASAADAVRFAAHQTAQCLPRKKKKKSKNSIDCVATQEQDTLVDVNERHTRTRDER